MYYTLAPAGPDWKIGCKLINRPKALLTGALMLLWDGYALWRAFLCGALGVLGATEIRTS